MKKFYNKVQIVTYYYINGDFLLFEDNPLHNKTFRNVNVEIKTETRTICGTEYEKDVICIDGEKPISCYLLGTNTYNNNLILMICQDCG